MNPARALLDGQWLPAEAPIASATSEAFQYGLGVFSSIGVREGTATWAAYHEKRLLRDAAKLGFTAAPREAWTERLNAVAAANAIHTGSLKAILFVDHGHVREWIGPRTTADKPGPAAPVTACIENCEPRAGRAHVTVKGLNYAHHLLAAKQARARGFAEVLWVDSTGRLLEFASGSLFLVRKGELLTPPIADGILQGVARERILALFQTARECSLTTEDLAGAEEVFLSNAVRGVVPISTVGDNGFASPGPITERVSAAVLADFSS